MIPFSFDFKMEQWTLFLDRDGVINTRTPNDYVKRWADFEFLPKAVDAIVGLSPFFHKIVIVTNQAGIGKGLYSAETLNEIHQNLIEIIKKAGANIDNAYFCPHRKEEKCSCRKPQIGMGLQAKADFSSINFEKSIMVGDSISDMDFGKNLGMKTVLLEGKAEEADLAKNYDANLKCSDLYNFFERISVSSKKF